MNIQYGDTASKMINLIKKSNQYINEQNLNWGDEMLLNFIEIFFALLSYQQVFYIINFIIIDIDI